VIEIGSDRHEFLRNVGTEMQRTVRFLWCIKRKCRCSYGDEGLTAVCPWVHDIAFCDILINFVPGSIIPRLKCAVVRGKVVGR
jgi:hypothetical protein